MLAATVLVLLFASAAALTELTVKVLVLRLPNGERDTADPYYDAAHGTMPLDASGQVDLPDGASLATSLTTADIDDIFVQVNTFYAPAEVVWKPEVSLVRPTAPCGGIKVVCGKYKCRTGDYFTKYFGTINKKITKLGREERAANFFSMIPKEHFEEGAYHMLYVKYIGLSSQGVVVGSPSWLSGKDGSDLSLATCGQFSNKFTANPVRRPNTNKCGGPGHEAGGMLLGCGVSLAYTTAHELGHLMGLDHTDEGSVMTKGGGLSDCSKVVAASTHPKEWNHMHCNIFKREFVIHSRVREKISATSLCLLIVWSLTRCLHRPDGRHNVLYGAHCRDQGAR